jgi:hypothetical protein
MITNRCAHRLGIAGAIASLLTIAAVQDTVIAAPGLRVGAAVDPSQVGVDRSWWSGVTADLARQEYAAIPTAAGLQAPNRALNLRTTFGERGIEVVPRTGKDVAPTWRFAWETGGIGRPSQMHAVEPVSPTSEGSRVTYRREGWSEWYENTAKGLEQGFTIERKPAGEGPLRIAGSFPAALRAEVREDGAIDFIDDHGACVIRCGELHAWDARGAELSSKLVVAGSELAIVIEDRVAEYPLTVDPLMTSPAWTAESNQILASFGVSVAAAGDVNGDGFSDVIVGAWQYDNGETDEGRAFVYLGSTAGLAIGAAWTAESNQASATFGYSVATAGDVNRDGYSDVVIGAFRYDNGETDEGRVFVYHGSASGLAATPSWTAESGQAGSLFGLSVATAGDVNGDGFSDVIVGALAYDNGETDEGRAFAYQGSASGLASTPAWTAESNQGGTEFGATVATAGDVNGDGFSDVLVGASTYDNGETDEGRAFAYYGSAGGLGTTAAWTVESDQANARLGNCVATAGDVNGDGFSEVIVGVWQDDHGQPNEGRVYVYRGSAVGLAITPAWYLESNQSTARFGFSAGTAGDVNGDGFADVIVGAYEYDNGEANEGRAFVYLGSALGLGVFAAWTAESNQGSARFGISVATAGDVNGDGFSDVIVGADQYDNSQANEGRVFVYHGAAAGVRGGNGVEDWHAEGDQAGARFGWSVAAAGDVNGDGFSDVIVGAPLYFGGQQGEGVAFVYHGSAAGLATTPAWFAQGDQQDAHFGSSVATAGDVNGDGYSDVIVGADSYANGQAGEGRSFVYYGSPVGLAATPAWTAEGDQVSAFFGASVATAGDVNGDGYSDVIVGAYDFDNGQSNEGRVFLYHGSALGLATSPAWTAESDQVGASFGCSVATAGDVNGDGYSDVIVGANRYDNGQTDEGQAFAYHGSPVGLATSPAWAAESDQVSAFFGGSVATVGDVNGDGYSDVFVGAETYDNGEEDEGRAFLYHGSAGGLSPTPNWIVESDQANGAFGFSVGGAGDVNGDGFSDVIVGAWHFYFPSQHLFEGWAFAYYGNEGDGLDRIARQARTDDSAPISLLGRSDSESAFRLKAFGRTAAGRGRVRLQFEVKPFGVPFDGLGLATGAIFDTGAPSQGIGSAVPLSELASGLAPGTLYHWRLRIAADSPFFPRSPWLTPAGNALTEADLRTAEAVIAVEQIPAPAARLLLLEPIRPNPLQSQGEIAYTLPGAGRVRLAAYDVAGRQVAVLTDGVQESGRHFLRWDGRDAGGHALSAGVYVLRLETAGRVTSRKVVITR